MFEQIVSRKKLFLKQLLPLGFLVAAIILDRSNFLPMGGFKPLLSYGVLYYWSLYRPDWIFLPGLVAGGLLDDSLSGAVLGQTAILFLLIYGAVLNYMDFFKYANFMVSWGTFMVMMGAVGLLEWTLYCILYDDLINIQPFIGQNILNGFVFPLPYWILNRIAMHLHEWE